MKYRKISFWTATNTYGGTRIALLAMMSFISIICLFLLGIFFGFGDFLGGTASGQSWVSAAVIGSFALFTAFMLKSMDKEWPKCGKHNERLIITKREDGGETVLMTFECPKKDKKVKLLSEKPSSRRNRRTRGRRMGRRHRRSGRRGFGRGRFGGGGAGR